MATKRYSGNVTVAINYVDSENHYKATVSAGGKRGKTVIVNPPRHLTKAVDSAEAYDNAAKAAVSFAEDDGFDASGAEYTGSGIAIRRHKPSHGNVAAPRGFTRAKR